MTFPTTPILDNFNRADEGPPPSDKWHTANDGLAVVSNQATATQNDDYGWNNWEDEYFGEDTEMYFTIVTKPATDRGFRLYMLDWSFSDGDGYSLDFFTTGSGTANFVMRRFDEWSDTQLGAAVTDEGFSNGDKLGFAREGDDVVGYKDTGSGWEEFMRRTDNTHKYETFALIIEQYDGSFDMVIDDFGGGTTVVAGGGGIMTPRTGYWGDL